MPGFAPQHELQLASFAALDAASAVVTTIVAAAVVVVVVIVSAE